MSYRVGSAWRRAKGGSMAGPTSYSGGPGAVRPGYLGPPTQAPKPMSGPGYLGPPVVSPNPANQGGSPLNQGTPNPGSVPGVQINDRRHDSSRYNMWTKGRQQRYLKANPTFKPPVAPPAGAMAGLKSDAKKPNFPGDKGGSDHDRIMARMNGRG